MTPSPPPDRVGRTIHNPISGERIVILTDPDDGQQTLVWELVLDPGGRVPASHAHPRQEERFTVLAGELRMRVGRQRIRAEAGATVSVPPGTVHSFANPGPDATRVLVHTRPALGMRTLLEVAAAMAGAQHAEGRRLPRLLDLVLFMREFQAEVAAPYVPRVLVRPVLAGLSLLARAGRPRQRYRRLRGAVGDPA
ncbi:MAG TPA: cupin domain-containing protein [Pseudonocardiaceae bacterium]|jgi:quercetin dioxygenase-like cupin family protein|nr:cupin domain-containing protein [Pseudonocardiaceae bacterium]